MSNTDNLKRYKEKRRALTDEFAESRPRYMPGKKLVLYAMAAIMILLAINIVMGAAFYIVYSIPLTADIIFSFAWQILISFIFACVIYTRGLKVFALLMLLGAGANIYLLISQGVFLHLDAKVILLNMYGISSVIASSIQIILIAIILFTQSGQTFFSVEKEINTQLKNEFKI
jgi:hypothetical protein